MLTYSAYKFLHIVFVFVFLTSASVALFSEGGRSRGFTIVSHGAGLLIFFSGLATLYYAGEFKFPFWVVMKFVLWLGLMAYSAVAVKRLRNWRVTAYLGFILLSSAVVYFAVHKPL